MSEDTPRANPKPSSVDRLSLLWRRVNDHKIAQWSVAYVAVAYAIQHGVILTSESFEWPNAVARISMLLLAFGLPVVMTFAWYHGARASRQFSRAELTIISILLVIGSLLFYAFVQPSAEIAAGPKPAVQQAGVAAARGASLNPASAISIAVLPFTNLSDDKQQEFFSDGMTEEITSALTKVPDLRVVGRTSAFEFKGQNRNLRDIGQALSATHLLEGSVRKAGNRLRITAQLVKAEDGVNVWSDSYDRELTDVFAIQEDIARAIAAALRMPLNLPQGQQLVSSRTNNLDIYQEYLRVKVLVRARGVGAREDLESLIKRDPNFAPAWALMADGYAARSVGATRQSGSDEEIRKAVKEALDTSEMAARKAMALDPTLAPGFAELGKGLQRRGKWVEAEDVLRKALALDPDGPEALSDYSGLLASVGRLKDALPLRVQLRTTEPFDIIYNINTARIMSHQGQAAAGIALLESISPDIRLNYNRNVALAQAYAEQGRYGDAVNTLLLTRNPNMQRAVEQAADVLRSAPKKTPAPKDLPVLLAELNFVYAHVGAPERILDELERKARIGNLNGLAEIWNPLYAPLRKTERFKILMRKAGVVDYWRARGWPDLCRPMGANDFACD